MSKLSTKEIVSKVGISESLLYVLFNEGYLSKPEKKEEITWCEGKPRGREHYQWFEGDEVKIKKALIRRKNFKQTQKRKKKKASAPVKTEYTLPGGWSEAVKALNLVARNQCRN
jgi:hypothetical protein